MSALLALSDTTLAALQARLDRLAAGAAGGALLSVTLDLGAGGRDWLQRPPASREFCYWARPDAGVFRLGLGRAVVCTSAGPARFTALQAAHAGIAGDWRRDAGGSAHAPVACLGFAFDENSGGELPNAQLGVAAVLLATAGGRCSATFTTPARDRAGAVGRWQKLLAAAPPGATATVGAALAGVPAGALAKRAWNARVQRALDAIAAGELEKVVLSRSLRLPLAGRVSPAALLARLLERHPESTIFAVGSENAVFLGATPEQLVGFAAGEVRADALAGTAWDDEPLAVDKNAHEQALVVAAIREALSPLCATLALPPAPRVLELRDLRHLWTPIAGRVKPGIGLFDLIARLHPTPAVGGWPGEAACDWLRRHGEKRPGWYAGGTGWIDRDGNGEIAVALRCGLLTARHIELPAGAGIVAGSRAEHEFRETEAKLATMLGALRADADQARTGTC
ncbi:MAG: isochorismate synthase [Rhodocyclales bacterium]|nr:isochorismate synthase [Rhodocyclales bacterium]